MQFAIDVGNSNTVFGLFRDSDLLRTWRISTERRRTADEYGALLEWILAQAALDPRSISGAIVSSVVPATTDSLVEALRTYWEVDPFIAALVSDPGIGVRYSPRHSVGSDRIANALGLRELVGSPAIAVDFGTSTNFDVVAPDGAFVGGAIAPGLLIGQEALVTRTAQLSRVPLEPPPMAIGTSTLESLQSGIVLGYVCLVDGLIERMHAELGGAAVVATGGLAGVVAPLSRTITRIEPNLTLIGLNLMYCFNVRPS